MLSRKFETQLPVHAVSQSISPQYESRLCRSNLLRVCLIVPRSPTAAVLCKMLHMRSQRDRAGLFGCS